MNAAQAAGGRPGPDEGSGLAARRLACDVVAEVLRSRAALDEVFESAAPRSGLDERDQGLARAIAVVSFRRLGTIRAALAGRLAAGLPRDGRLFALLVTGSAQILFLDVPDHAAVGVAVELARTDRHLHRYSGLVNAVLRRIARERDAILQSTPPLADAPDWLARRWCAAYGEATARAIAAAHRGEAPIDLSVKADPGPWAERLGATLLPTGSIRLTTRGAIRDLPGYAEGAWWVQDAAAALPARLIAARPGERIADLCAAPGGKTAQLAATGAAVVAVDRSEKRMRRLAENLARLRLAAELRTADVLDMRDEAFDAVLLDAPCSATGTLRRHPDVAWTKREEDIAKLGDLQGRLLARAASLVRPGGRLVYCTCSLEPDEGERQVDAFLACHPEFAPSPVDPGEIGGLPDLVTRRGELRTLPHQLGTSEGRSGLDGFFAARLARKA